MSTHVALHMLLAFSQPVNCIFCPIITLNWLVAASKLQKHRGTCCTAEWPYCPFAILWYFKLQKTSAEQFSLFSIFNFVRIFFWLLDNFIQVRQSAPLLPCFKKKLFWRAREDIVKSRQLVQPIKFQEITK